MGSEVVGGRRRADGALVERQDQGRRRVPRREAVTRRAGAIPPPPDWLTAKKPVEPTAPPAAVSTDDPRTVGKLYSPNLVQQYGTQQLLYRYSSAALSDLENREEKAKALGLDLSEDEKKQKAVLAGQVAAAQAAMLQARKDYEMLDNPATTPQQLQEMFARRGIAVPVVAQTHQTGASALEGSGISGWGIDEKGLTKKTGTATTRTVIGPDGRPVAITDEDTKSTNIGLGTAKQVTGTKVTVVQGDTSSVVDTSKTTSVDILKGEGSVTKDTTKTVTDASGTTTKTSDKTTYTAGVGGVTRTKEDSTQVGSKVDSTASTRGITRGPGQLGITAADTKKSGTMVGPPGQEKMEKGTEQSNKLSGGLVSDDKGIGIGGTASQERKTMFGEGKTVGTTVAAGGRCQALVAEVPGSEPPRFTITTTISFDLKLGATAGKEWQAKPGAQQDTGLKGNVSIGGGAAIGAYAAFKRELTEAEAKEYIDYVKANGRGSKLPEHKILATGASQGWDAAKQLWLAMNGSPDMLKSMKPGEQVETNVELGGDAKLGAGGGQSAQGGTTFGGEVTAKGKHKINVQKSVLPDGRIQITAAIDDEGELGGAVSVGVGAASMKGGKSYTAGQGRTIVFILSPSDPAFNSQVTAIDAAATPEDLDRIATQNRSLVAAKTDKTVEGEGTSVGAGLGPLSIDLAGKGKLTSEVTRDQQGNVIGQKYTGENQGGGTIGVGDVRVGDTKSEKYVGQVDKEGRAKGELSETKKSTSFGKSVLGAGSKITNDPLGTVLSRASCWRTRRRRRAPQWPTPRSSAFATRRSTSRSGTGRSAGIATTTGWRPAPRSARLAPFADRAASGRSSPSTRGRCKRRSPNGRSPMTRTAKRRSTR